MIVGNKVLLRSFKKDDLESIVKIHNDIEIKKLAMYHPFPVSYTMDEIWLDRIVSSTNNDSIYFVIEEKDTQCFAGFVSLTNMNWINRNYNFGIIIDQNFQGKGFGKETTELILNYSFQKLNMRKVSLNVLSENTRAINLYKKLGFKEEGILKEQFYWDGEYQDIVVMSKIKTKSEEL